MSNQPPFDPQGQPGNPNNPQYPSAPQPGQGGAHPAAPQQGQPGGFPSAPQQGGPGGYQAAPQIPGQGGFNPPPANVTKPKSIDLAVKLMYAGAALSVLNIIVSLLSKDAIKDSIRDRLGDGATTKEIDDAFAGFNVQTILGGIIGIALWVLMAKMNESGKSWARIVATVLGAINVIGFLIGLAFGSTPILLLVGLVSVALAAFILFLLWKKESSDYYKAKSAPQF